jgi:hypothetical protein
VLHCGVVIQQKEYRGLIYVHDLQRHSTSGQKGFAGFAEATFVEG